MNKLLIAFLFVCVANAAFGQTVPEVSCLGVPNLTFVPKPGSCRDLYQCVDGIAVIRHCPDNLFFDYTNKVCTYPAWSKCVEDSSSNPEETTTENVLLQCPSEEITFIPHTASCNKYYVCAGLGSNPVEFYCYDEFEFSETLLQCVPKEVADCSIHEANCPDDLDDGEMIFVPHPSDCSAYFVCMNHQEHQFSCAPGFVWNYLADSCDYPENVVCGGI